MSSHATALQHENASAKPDVPDSPTHSQARAGLPLFLHAADAGEVMQRRGTRSSPSAYGNGGECAGKSRIQAKLRVGNTDDPLEAEADRMAEQVLASSEPAGLGTSIQKVEGQPGGVASATAFAPESVDRVLANSGAKLEPALKTEMEQRFGRDFSQVRVHTDAGAECSARDINARAYTLENNVVFGAGAFAPSTLEGRKLLAHELAHVVQQTAPGRLIEARNDSRNRSGVLSSTPRHGGSPVIARAPSEPVPDEWIIVSAEKTSDPSDDRWFVYDHAGKQLKSLLPEGTQVLATGKPVPVVRGDQKIELRQVRVVSLPGKEGDPSVVGKLGMVQTRFLKPAATQSASAATSSPPSPLAKAQEVPGAAAVEAWAGTERDAESIEYVFADDMAGKLKTINGVSAFARQRLAQAFPATGSGIGLAVDVVRSARGETGQSSEALVDQVRVASEPDRTAIHAFLATAQGDHATAVGQSLTLDAEAIEKDPLAVFKRRLQSKVISRLNENLAVLDGEERKYANTDANSREWEHLRKRVAPLIKRDLELQETLADLKAARPQLQAPITAIAQQPVLQGASGASAASPEDVAVEALGRIDAQYLAPEETEHVYDGGDGPAMKRIRRSLEIVDQRIFVMHAAHRGFLAEYPIAAGIEAGQLESDASNETIMATLRTGFFADFRATIKSTIADIESGDIPLHKLTKFIEETHSELGYDKNPVAKRAVEDWLTSEANEEALIQAVIGGAVLALTLAALVVSGGTAAIVLGVLGAAGGIADAAYNYEKAADIEQLASAGDIANEMVEDRDDAKFNYWMAVFGLALSALDLGVLKNAGKSAVAALPKRAAAVDDPASLVPRGPALTGDPAAASIGIQLNKKVSTTQIGVGDSYAYNGNTHGKAVAELARDLEAKGKKVVIGTGGHGSTVGYNFINTPMMANDRFLLGDLDLGWEENFTVLDLTNAHDYARFKAYEDAARAGSGTTATIRAWCHSANDPLP